MGVINSISNFFNWDSEPNEDLIKKVAARHKSLDLSGGNTEQGIGLDLEAYNLMAQLMGTPDERIAQYSIFDHLDKRYSEVSLALDTFADETILVDLDKQKPFWITSNDQELVDLLESLFFDVLDWRDGTDLNIITRNFCKYGDGFSEVVVDNVRGVTKVKELPVKSIWADFDIMGNNHRWIQRFVNSAISTTQIEFEPWQIYHTKLPAKTTGQFYGGSMLQDAILPSRMLEAVELATMLSRINGSVKRYLYKIPVGNRNAQDTKKYLAEVKQALRKKNVINTSNGQFVSVNDIMTAVEDLFIPVREQGSIEIETLDERNRVADKIEDIEYFKTKANNALKMPNAYISQEEMVDSNNLSKGDLRFARRIQKVQNVVRGFLKYIGEIHVGHVVYGISDPFNVQLASVSQLEEQLMLENLEMRYNLVGTMEQFIPREKLYTDILKFSEEETEELLKILDKQKKEDVKKESVAQAEAEVAAMEIQQSAQIDTDDMAMEEVRKLMKTNPSFRIAVENIRDLGKQYLEAQNKSK